MSNSKTKKIPYTLYMRLKSPNISTKVWNINNRRINKKCTLTRFHQPPQHMGAEIAISRCCIVVLLESMRVRIDLGLGGFPDHLASNQNFDGGSLVERPSVGSHHLGGERRLALQEQFILHRNQFNWNYTIITCIVSAIIMYSKISLR